MKKNHQIRPQYLELWHLEICPPNHCNNQFIKCSSCTKYHYAIRLIAPKKNNMYILIVRIKYPRNNLHLPTFTSLLPNAATFGLTNSTIYLKGPTLQVRIPNWTKPTMTKFHLLALSLSKSNIFNSSTNPFLTNLEVIEFQAVTLRSSILWVPWLHDLKIWF